MSTRYLSLSFLTILTSLSLAAGCGGSVKVSPAGGSGEATGGSGGATGGSGGAGGGSAAVDCAQACSPVAEGSCLTMEDCMGYCSEVLPLWPESVSSAFAACVADNPLCYQTMDDCIFGLLHPAGTVHSILIAGAGFDAFEGKTLRIWHDPGLDIPFGGEQTISGGGFDFAWNVAVPAGAQGGPLLLFYIDMDANGACEAATDVTGAVTPEWNGDFISPVFSSTLTTPLQDPDFVCQFQP